MTEPQTAVPLPGDQVNENDDIVTLGRSNLQWVRLNSGLSLLDSAIVAVLGKGDQVVGVSEYGTSSWAETKRIDVQAIDGSKRSYFLKTLSDPDAEVRVHGEYEAMSAIYQTMPNMAPKPRGCGPCAEKKGTFFFVCDYVNLAHGLPDAVELGKKLAEFHLSSKSPTGKFGFHCTTFDGKNPLNNSWNSSWTSYFRQLMNDLYQIEKASNGYWKEFDDVIQITLDRLIPRLLDVLVLDGRTIKPTLIHGDLWESNIGTDEQTKEIFIYDACAYYAHHEKEVGIWRCAHHKMTDEKYRREYFKHYPPSEPREEADDRNRLYSVQTRISTSLDFPGLKMREQIMADLNYLIDKYELRDK